MSNYYVSGCVSDGDNVSICDDSVAQFWTLYHRNEEGLSEGIIDCMFREDAETAMRAYEERDALEARVKQLEWDSVFIPKDIEAALAVMGVALPESKEEFSFSINRWVQRLVDRVVRFGPELDAERNKLRDEGVELVKAHPAISLCSLTHVCEEIANQLRAGKDGV
jgi:hypothetical protein